MHHPLEAAIDHLTAVAEDHPDELRIWAVAALASKLGLGVVVTPGGDELEAINEVGTAFVDMVMERLDDEPDQRRDTLRAAYKVVERLVGAVRSRGLSGNACLTAASRMA